MSVTKMQVVSPPKVDTDLYKEFKSLEKHLEFVDLQEEYLKDEMRQLQRELLRAKEEIRRIQSVPLVIGQFNEMIDANYGVVSSTAGSNYYVRILSTLDRELLKPNTSVALHRHSHSVVDILPPESDSTIKLMAEKPDVSYKDIGGLDIQKQEVREAIELPLIQHHLYEQIGIDPPRGVLLYGPPGTGKTMMAKAVANSTNATFISMVGSEFVQKYLGEGPRMVRDVFRLARENSPCIVFIDEIDAIATKRFDSQTGADREVQRVYVVTDATMRQRQQPGLTVLPFCRISSFSHTQLCFCLFSLSSRAGVVAFPTTGCSSKFVNGPRNQTDQRMGLVCFVQLRTSSHTHTIVFSLSLS
jgi:26S proteasome regulatory subunit T3